MHGSIPRDLGGCRCPGPNVIYCANVAAAETQARAVLKHDFVRWVSGVEREFESRRHSGGGKIEVVGFGKKIIDIGKRLIGV